MTDSTISAGNVVTNFQRNAQREYVRAGRFGPHTGTTENAIFQVNRDLKKHSIPLVAKIGGAGVRGSTVLRGSEVALSNYDQVFTPTYKRQGVSIDNEENEKAEFDLFQEARPALMSWAMEQKRYEQIQALGAIYAGSTYANLGGTVGATGSVAASAANRDTWQAANTDRILYGAARANLTSGDHTTSLATVDTTADKSTMGRLELLKRMAETASPLIRPVMVRSDEPWFVYYCGSFEFRDLRADAETRHQNALPRSVTNNPLFTGGDLFTDGIIIKKVPEIDTFIDSAAGGPFDGIWGAGAASTDGLDNGGATASRVGIGFLCGAQAVIFGLGRMPTFARSSEDDYGHMNAVAITRKDDQRKAFYNAKQHGIVTSFASVAVDA